MKKLIFTLAVATLGFVACEKDEIGALNDDLIETRSDLQDAIDQNAAADAASDQRLQAALDALEAASEAGDADLAASLSAAVENLNSLLAAEAAAREAGDSALASSLADAVSNLNAAIAAEAAAREAGDADLAASLQSAINSLNSLIASEASARRAGDSALAADLESARMALQAAIDAEEDAREAGDSELQSNINSAIADLNTAIDAAEVDAINAARLNTVAAINGLRDQIGGQLTTINTAITALQTDLDAAELAIDAQGETDGTHASTLTSIQTSINNLRSSLETFATNGDNTLRDAINGQIEALQIQLNSALINIRANTSNIQGVRVLALAAQASVDALNIPQAVSISSSGTILTITVGTQSYEIDQSGGSAGSAGDAGNGIASTSYDAATGILTLNFTDGTSFSTEDIRGAAGADGDDGDDGVAGPAGADGQTIIIYADAGFDIDTASWLPALGTQTADFVQTGTDAAGVTATRTIEVTASSPVVTGGGSSVSSSFTSNGSALTQTSYDDVVAAVTQVGTYAIVETRVTTIAESTSTITYSAPYLGTSHDVAVVTPESSSSETINHPDIVNVAADVTDPGFVISDPVQTRGGDISNLRDGDIAENYFLIDGSAVQYASLDDARRAIPVGQTLNISEVLIYNQIQDVSAIETLYIYQVAVRPDGSNAQGDEEWRESTAAQTGVDAGSTRDASGTGSPYSSLAADTADTVASFGSWSGTAPSSTTITGQFGSWEGTAPAGVPTAGAVTTRHIGAGATRQLETTTQMTNEIAAYTETRSRIDVSVVAEYTETRSRLITVNGVADSDYSGSQYTNNGDGTFTETESRQVAEVRTNLPAVTESRQVAAQSLPLPASVVLTADPEQTGFSFPGDVTVSFGRTAIFGNAVKIYDSNDNLVGSFTGTGGRNNRVTFAAPAAGSYYAEFFADSVALATSDATYVDFTVDADGIATLD